MLEYVYCNSGKIAAVSTQFPAAAPVWEGDDHTSTPAQGDKAQQAVADGCVSITCPEANEESLEENYRRKKQLSCDSRGKQL